MSFDATKRTAINNLQMQLDGKLSTVLSLFLIPEQKDNREIDFLSTWQYISSLPNAEQNALHIKTVAIYVEIQKIIGEMQRYVNEIGEELEAVRIHNIAMKSYHEASKTAELTRM